MFMNKNIIIIVVLILLLAGGFLLMRGNSAVLDSEQNTATENAAVSEENVDVSAESSSSATTSPQVKEFTVVGTNFAFSVPEMRVNEGDTVRIHFKSSAGLHDWKIDEFSAATAKLQGGQEETIEFVADKKGTFEYYCSVGSHRQMGMKGNLIVE